MAWPATNWYLPGGKGMIRNAGGVITAVPDADECCCEECSCPTDAYCLANHPNPLYIDLTGGPYGRCADIWTLWRPVLSPCRWFGVLVANPVCAVQIACVKNPGIVPPACGDDCAWLIDLWMADALPGCKPGVYWKCDHSTPLGVYTYSGIQPGCPATLTVYS